MSIAGRIRAFQVVLTLAVLAMAAIAVLSVRGANYYIDRVQLSRHQVDAMTELAIRANRFSEQIAELLLIGEPERVDFDDAREKLRLQFGILRRLAREEDDLVSDPDNDVEEQEEALRLDQMRTLVREINRAVERVLLLDQQGRRDEAVALFRSDIENRFDRDFEALIIAAVEDEREDVLEADATAQRLSSILMIAALAMLGLLLALVVVSGWRFTRSLRRPIDALVEGAEAVERGNLDHRIAYAKRDEFGLVAGRFNAMADRLEQQRNALLAARSHLERQVAERTQEIAAANLRLTEIDRQRVQFLGDISHELRTPLTVLRAEAEVTLRGASKPEEVYRETLETIVAQAAEMGDLVDELLFLARSEAGEIRFDFGPVPAAAVVAKAVQDASVLANARNIRIAVECQEPGPVVRADPRRLKQALVVTLDNAVRYAAAGTEILVKVGANGDGFAEISVNDRGLGIPPEEVPRVFDRFYRGSRAAEAGAGGSGLGLPIAQWIVEKHDGRMDLQSKPGVGTEVRFSLPLAA
jgi:signal transduction histidine kinase